MLFVYALGMTIGITLVAIAVAGALLDCWLGWDYYRRDYKEILGMIAAFLILAGFAITGWWSLFQA